MAQNPGESIGGVFVDLSVSGKRFLITGGSRGLGRAVAEELAREGGSVVITSRRLEVARAVADQIPGASGMALDTGDGESLARFVQQWGNTPVDGLFVNTGGPRPGEFFDLSPDDWIKAFSQLVYGPVLLVRGLSSALVSGGALLFNTSSSIRVPIPNLFLSNVLRPAVEALAKGLSLELAARQIRVNVIAPGRIATERVDELDRSAATRTGMPVEHVRAVSEGAIPLGRYGLPAEFGRAGAFLLSPAASYISGVTLFVDGGQTKAL